MEYVEVTYQNIQRAEQAQVEKEKLRSLRGGYIFSVTLSLLQKRDVGEALSIAMRYLSEDPALIDENGPYRLYQQKYLDTLGDDSLPGEMPLQKLNQPWIPLMSEAAKRLEKLPIK